MPSFPSHIEYPLRIKLLDNRLANQIAAGEVVERPASVVKELLENAIDAAATRIELEIERGGTRLIRVSDNGDGIVKEDLPLALARHATSKIFTSQDLAAINSLGFRGEALASISSVSKLCLTSRIQDSEFAWQAIAEGRNMEVEILPAAATVGTRIEVRDLFYNTPARQKFLKAEKTEFHHIEEIFKRHALANPSIAFILKHNNKIIKRVPASQQETEYLNRIEAICGEPFAKNAHQFCCDHDEIKVQGWLGGIDYHRSESDIQYVYLNARPVKDKMLNHAIRQAYQGLLPPGRMPTFVIFLTVDLNKVDVNVHPTKHEVRFDEQRMVHDLLVKSISEELAAVSNRILQSDSSEEVNKLNFFYPKSRLNRNASFSVGYSKVSYGGDSIGEQNSNSNYSLDEETEASTSLRTAVSKVRLNELFWIILDDTGAYLVNEKKLFANFFSDLLSRDNAQKSAANNLSNPLLFPQTIKMNLEPLEELANIERLEKLGFVFEPKDMCEIVLQKIPNWLSDYEVNFIVNNFEQWASFLMSNNESSVHKFYQSIRPISSVTIAQLVGDRRLSELHDSSSKISSNDLQNKIT